MKNKIVVILFFLLIASVPIVAGYGMFDYTVNSSASGYGGYEKLSQCIKIGENGQAGTCDYIALLLDDTHTLGSGQIDVSLLSGTGNPGGLATMDTGVILSSDYTSDEQWFYVYMDDGDTLVSGNYYTILVDFNDALGLAVWSSTATTSDVYTVGDPYAFVDPSWYKIESEWGDYNDFSMAVLSNWSIANFSIALSNHEETSVKTTMFDFNDTGWYPENTSWSGFNPISGLCTLGYWIRNATPINNTNFNKNYTATLSSAPIKSGTVEISIATGLTSGTYYYLRPWVRANVPGSGYYNFNSSDDYHTFLTKPNPPTNLDVASKNSTNITLTWTNATVHVSNQTTMIRYKAGSYPTGTTDGTLAYNGTATTTTIEGLEPSTAYYFKAWTYINASGSPYYWWFSDNADTTFDTTVAGAFNITFRWECNHSLIDNTSSLFTNSTLWAESYTGELRYYNDSLKNNPHVIPGNVTGVDIVFFDYNTSGQIRSIIPASTDDPHNITFFVCCYPNYNYSGYNYSEYQLYYIFSIEDNTLLQEFSVSNQSHISIYDFNSSGKFYIHQDFLDVNDQIGVYLHYGERYFIGIRNPNTNLPFIQYIDTNINQDVTITIYPISNTENYINKHILINTSWNGGLNFTFFDTLFSINYVNVTYYNVSGTNQTEVHWYNFTTDTENYGWAGATENYTYYIVFNINSSLYTSNQTYVILYIPGFYGHSITNVEWINNQLNQFMVIPIPNITWTQALACIFTLIIFLSVGIVNASAGFISAGATLAIMNGIIFFESNATTLGSYMVGITMIILGIIFARGELLERSD